MIRWIPYTFVRTVIFFIAGILLGIYLPDAIATTYALAFLGILAIVYFILFFLQERLGFQTPWFGIVGLAAIFIMGYSHVLFQNEIRDDSHFSRNSGKIEAYRVVLTSYAERKAKSWKVTGEVSHIKTGEWKNTSGKVLLYFPANDFETPFNYGDVLVIKGAPREVPSPSNPGEFDYKRFLTFRNIYHQHFVKKPSVAFVRHDPPNILMDLAVKARVWSHHTLDQFVSGKQEQAIAAALVLGVTDGLDNELLNAYAATGAMHVLAVSGLHISIIYIIILWMLKPLTKTNYGKWFVVALCVVILWGYAFITGLSPSVLRAVTMFTFMATARATSRTSNIYNTLAASGFCLLVFDPFLIMSVGFQLSYLAVLGIVYLQPLLYNLLEFRTWIMDQVWKIICVSVAAQLATFALGLLYFHQFPNYFLLSNLLVIPISFGVLILGLLLLAVSFVNIVATAVGYLLTICIQLMNLSVLMVEWFPYSLIEGVYITTLQCWLLMGIILLLIGLIRYRDFRFLPFAAMLTAIFVVLQWHHFHIENGKDKITVYNVPGHSAIDLISEGKAWFVTDSMLVNDAEKIRFHIRPNRLHSGVTAVFEEFNSAADLPTGGKVIVWRGRTILYVTDEKSLTEGIDADIVIVGNNAVRNPDHLRAYGSTPIIFDSSNTNYYTRSINEEARSLQLNVHSVWEGGAVELTLENKQLNVKDT